MLLFDLEVVWHGVDEKSAEEAEHTQEHKDTIIAEVGMSVHGKTPEWGDSYLTIEYLWKRKAMFETTMWLA